MKYIETDIKGVWIIEPKVFDDARGYFMEAWKKEEFEAHVGMVDFVQDNESKSSYGVLRGLHYQKGDASQAKLVRVIKGRVVDVAVDIRKSSPTFGKHVMVELSETNKRQLFIPRGFAHGFLIRLTTFMLHSKRPASDGTMRLSAFNGPLTRRTLLQARRTLEAARCAMPRSSSRVC